MDDVFNLLKSCSICPRNCRVNRLSGEKGYCHAGAGFEIASITLHRGEEPVISGKNGICNVFFYHCNLQCLYCQNYQISSKKCLFQGKVQTQEEVLEQIKRILDTGVENLGFVSPSHMIPQMIRIIKILREEGYRPITVYNTNSYDTPETLRFIEEWVDVYLPDFKYSDAALSEKWSGSNDYPEVAARALQEMYYQKGNSILINDNGKAERGMIIRHLVLPGETRNSINVLRHIAHELSNRISISLMSQYYPISQVKDISPLNRSLYRNEYETVCREMEKLGFTKGWVQDFESSGFYLPDFRNPEPFREGSS